MKSIHTPASITAIKICLVFLFILSLGWFVYGNYQVGFELWPLVTSALLLSIPIGMLYFSIGVLAVASLQQHSQGQINERLAKYIYWTPRIAGVLITVFVGLFALDVFTEGPSIWEMLGGFLIHAMPAIFMGVVLALAWRRPWIGFIAFLAAAVYFLRFVFNNPIDLGLLLLFSGPMAAIALLFWADWKWLKRSRPVQKPV